MRKVNLNMKEQKAYETIKQLAENKTTKEIAAAFKEQCNVVIDKKKIQLDEAIKNFGVYKVNIKLHHRRHFY